jgi:MFS family permease
MSKFLAGRTAPLDTTDAARHRLTVASLYALVAFLYWASLYLYVPTLPSYVQAKSEGLALVGVVLAQYGLWQALVRLPLGIAADWLGWHKPFIVAGLALSGLGALALGTAGGVGQLAVGRAITGLAAGTWVPLVVVFSGLFRPHETVRATALLTFVGSAGRALASAVTGSLNALGGYALAFYLAAGVAALAALVLSPIPQPRRAPQRPSLAGIGRLVSRRDVLLPSLLAAVSQYANWAATFGFIPLLARQLGATDVTLSLLVSLHIGVMVTGNLVATALVRRTGARRLVYLSFLLLTGGLGLAALAPALGEVFVAQFWLGLAQGVGYPVLMGLSIRHVDEANRTTAMGLHQAVYAIGMFGGPWLSGVLAEAVGLQPMFGCTALACLVLGVALTRMMSAEDLTTDYTDFTEKKINR